MRFLKIKLENWTNFTKVDVEVQQRIFIAGPNASGKSNFLDAIRFLQDIASVGGGLQNAVADRGGVSRIRCLAARRYSDIAFEIELGLNPKEPEWKYAVVFNQDNLRRPVLKREVVHRCNRLVLERPDSADTVDPERLTQTHLEQVSANKEFRDISDFLGSVRYLHVVPQLVRDPERSANRPAKGRDPFGGDFLEQIAKTPERTLQSRFKRITEALRVAVPQLQELILQRDRLGKPHLQGRYEHWRPRGAWQTEDQFSDGTLRLLGLLWAVLDGTGPLLLEEPELSLHPHVVRFIPQMFWRATRKSRRQIFVTTHSPELLGDKGIAPDETLLLYPDQEGTKVVSAATDNQVTALLEAGLSIGDTVLPAVAPERPDQLALFGET